MITIIVMIIAIHLANKSYKKNQYLMHIENQRRYKQIQAIQAAKRKEAKRIAREKEKTIKQYERLAKQAEKERQQAQKTEQRKQQAESDIMFYQSQYDILYQLARQIETDIQETEKQIAIDKLTHSYDRVKTKENKLYQLTKKQVAIENQLYIMQNRINKAKHIIKAG